MAATVQITGLVEKPNTMDPQAIAVLDGTPSVATLDFYCARVPETIEDERELLQFAGLPDGSFLLTLPTPGLWYVWVADGNGFSAEPEAVWIENLGGKMETEALGAKLRDILRGHIKGLDFILRNRGEGRAPTVSRPLDAPTAQPPSVQQIIFGMENLIEQYPAIVIDEPRRDAPFVATSMCREVTISFSITVMTVHRDRTSGVLPTMIALAEGVQKILECPQYENIFINDTLHYRFCQPGSVTANEMALEGIGWGSEATLSWSAKRLSQQGL